MNKSTGTDIIIIGGGCAGIAASVAAAGKGMSVTLIEKNEFLGGNATAAEVGTVCGLYKFSKEEKAVYLVKGFAKDFADQLQNRSKTTPLSGSKGIHFLPYDVEAFKAISKEYLLKHSIQIFANTELKKVTITDGKINAVTVQTPEELLKISCKAIIDCSGTSTVSRLAQLPVIESGQYQAAAQVFTLTGLALVTEPVLDMILKKELHNAIASKKLQPHFDRVYIVPGSLKIDTVSLKLGIPLGVTNEPCNLAELKEAALLSVQQLTAFLIENVLVFRNARLQHIAPEPGVRVSARTAGKYVLSVDDVLGCKKFDNAIANASWPIEEWGADKRVSMRYFSLDDFYQVPAGCLQAVTIDNLFIAGKNISATDGAVASARVMGTCLQTGYAAGILAAGIVLNIPENDNIKAIQLDQM